MVALCIPPTPLRTERLCPAIQGNRAFTRRSCESRDPAILALWNANSYLASLDSGLRRNDGGALV